jgi:ABC-type Fe3+/spermidine/putrescine transport system ATPase subunit
MARELRQVQRGVNGTFIHVCHNFEEASDVADRIAIMNDGTIIQTGTLKEVMEAPENEFVARFMKSQNIFYGISDGSTIKIGKTVLFGKNLFKGDVLVVIRPENIAIVENENNKGQNVFSGKVESARLKPYFTEIAVDINPLFVIYSPTEKKYNKGDKITISIPPEKIAVVEKS